MPSAQSLAAALIEARLFWKLCLCGLVTGVLFLALLPQPPEVLSSGSDKLNHALAFAALAWSGYLGFAALTPSRRVPLALLLLAFGAAIELAQLVVPGRAGEWGDLLADTVGITAGCGLAMFFVRRTRCA